MNRRDVIGRAVDDAMDAAINTGEDMGYHQYRDVAERQIDAMVGVFDSLTGPTLHYARDRAEMYGPRPIAQHGPDHHVQAGILCALVDIADSLRIIAGRAADDTAGES